MSKRRKSGKANAKTKDVKKSNKPKMAETADRHALYQEAVQCVETETSA